MIAPRNSQLNAIGGFASLILLNTFVICGVTIVTNQYLGYGWRGGSDTAVSRARGAGHGGASAYFGVRQLMAMAALLSR